MTDEKEPKSNIVDIFSRKKNQEHDADVEAVLHLSDDLDDVLNEYIEAGVGPDLVAAVLANRLGVLLAAMKSAGMTDPVQIYLDIVSQTSEEKLGD